MADTKTKNDMNRIFGMIILVLFVVEAVPIVLDKIANLSGDGIGYTMLGLLGMIVGVGVLYMVYDKFIS